MVPRHWYPLVLALVPDVAALGAYLAHTLSVRWGLTPFRNGQVPMHASHIQITRHSSCFHGSK